MVDAWKAMVDAWKAMVDAWKAMVDAWKAMVDAWKAMGGCLRGYERLINWAWNRGSTMRRFGQNLQNLQNSHRHPMTKS